MSVSVVIPTYCRPEKLRLAVDSVRRHLPEAEIVIVNQNEQPCGLADIELPMMPGFPGPRRRAGIEKSSGDILVLMDDDNELVDWSRWNEVVVRLHEPNCGLIQVMLNGKHEWVAIDLGWTGGGIICRRRVYDAMGGYGEDYLDDVELFLRSYLGGFQNWRTAILKSTHHWGDGGLRALLGVKKKTSVHLQLSRLPATYPGIIVPCNNWLGLRLNRRRWRDDA